MIPVSYHGLNVHQIKEQFSNQIQTQTQLQMLYKSITPQQKLSILQTLNLSCPHTSTEV